jgi:DHA2 family multidrug resistance protein
MENTADYSKSKLQIALVVATAALASLLEIIDSSIVNVAIPTMMGNLGVTLDQISWVSTGYMIANSIILPIAAWLGMKLGRRTYFTGAILAFTAASFACGIAPNLLTLVIFRIIQGLSGGALLPTSQALIQEQFPPEKAGVANAVFGISVMVGPALGPVLGGYLTDHFGWRSIFNINVPIGIAAAIMSWTFVEETAFVKRVKAIDWTGLGLLCLGVGCLQYVLERGQPDNWWDSSAITTCAILGVIGAITFVWWELKTPNPIMDLRLFKESVVRSGTFLMLMLGIMLYSLTFIVPIFAAEAVHLDATQTGILYLPPSVITAMAMMPVGLLSRRVNPKILVFIGICLGITALLLMSGFSTKTGQNDIYLPLTFRGLAAAFLFVPINTMVLGQFRGEALGQVAGLMNFFRQLGGSIGIASLTTLMARFSAQNYADLLSHISALNPAAWQTLRNAQGLAHSKMSGEIGLGSAHTLAVKMLYQRTMAQVFVMSFDQICWVIVLILAVSLIPLYVAKTKRTIGGPVITGH